MMLNRNTTPRRGVASLELVLAFPMMLFCAAGVMYSGRAGLARTSAAISVRRSVFLEREKADSPSPLSVFETVDNPNSVETGRSFKTWIRGPKEPIARSKAATLTGEWNHYSVKFEPNRGLFTPHIAVLARFVGSTTIGPGFEKVVGGVGKAIEFVLTNKYLLTVGKAYNKVLDAGAVFFKYTLLPLLWLTEKAVKLANLNPFVSLGALDDVIDVYQTAVQSLVDATDEKPGNWNVGELGDLIKYFK